MSWEEKYIIIFTILYLKAFISTMNIGSKPHWQHINCTCEFYLLLIIWLDIFISQLQLSWNIIYHTYFKMLIPSRPNYLMHKEYVRFVFLQHFDNCISV